MGFLKNIKKEDATSFVDCIKAYWHIEKIEYGYGDEHVNFELVAYPSREAVAIDHYAYIPTIQPDNTDQLTRQTSVYRQRVSVLYIDLFTEQAGFISKDVLVTKLYEYIKTLKPFSDVIDVLEEQ